VQKAVTSANVSVITFSNLAPGSTQYYRVRANNLTGSSPWTTVGSITLPGVGTTHHINAGGGAYTDSQGRNYIADTGFSGGTISSDPFEIPNTTNDPLYYDRRWGSNFSFAQGRAQRDLQRHAQFLRPQ
jgi:hypothetical protein